MKYLSLLFIIALASCTPSVQKSAKRFPSINPDEVISITLANQYIPDDSISANRKQLSSEQRISLISKLNGKKQKGPYKCIVRYSIEVALKDNTKREFRVCGSVVKETTDWGYDIGDDNYFDNLWAELK